MAITIESGELGSPPRLKRGKDKSAEEFPGIKTAMAPAEVLARLERWHIAPSLVTAAEVVEAAIVDQSERRALDAARRLVAIDANAAPLIREQAARLLVRNGFQVDVPPGIISNTNLSERQVIRANPRDPLAWVELSFLQTKKGHLEAAMRSMSVALQLSRNNRHVVRSAARLFLHQGDADKALNVVRQSEAVKIDPWIMASEIALSQVTQRQSRHIKEGKRLVEGETFSARQITELAGSIGTEEIVSGNRKNAKKLFRLSMMDPTGSSAAQGEWATPSIGAELISETRLSTTFENAEALAFHAYRTKRFGAIATHCWNWAENDPFSIRPFEFGAASVGFIEQFDEVIAFAQRGLSIKPDSANLLNGLAFAKASLGLVDDASAALSKVPLHQDPVQAVIYIANQGLIEFRTSQCEKGIERYKEAIESLTR